MEMLTLWLEPGAEQHQVDPTCRQQRNRKRAAHAVQARFSNRLHDRNIGRFHRWSLGLYFSPARSWIYQSFTTRAPRKSEWSGACSRFWRTRFADWPTRFARWRLSGTAP